MNKSIVNWGILGCAGIAEGRVIPGILQASGAKLYAIASRSNSSKLQHFKDTFHPEVTYSTYEDLLSDPKVDAVYIPLPNGLHYEWVLKAAAMKKHILCEKPLGISKLQVRQMQAACDANNVVLMEAFAYRHSPQTKKVKEIVDSGIIGHAKLIESHFGYFLKNEEDVRFSEALYGGATFDIGCYNLNLIRYLAGSEPLKISAFGKVSTVHNVDEGSSVLMEFKDDLAGLSFCSLTIYPSCHYSVVGDLGILKVADEFNSKGLTKITVITSEKTEEITINCPDNYMLEIEQFGRVIHGEEDPLITWEDSAGNAAVIDESLRQIFGRKR